MCVCVCERERERSTSFIKSLLVASVLPGTESDFWPTVLSREQRRYQNSDQCGDHYLVGSLGQTRISLPEYLVSHHRHIMARE